MLALAAFLTLLPALTSAATCVQFDSDKNLYAFGGQQDVGLGNSSSWESPSPRTLSSDNRPPYTGKNMQCFLSQNANALYVYGGDENDQSSIYIYDFAGDKWSKQATSGAPSSIGNSRSSAILDHDTNVIYTIGSDGNSWQADMGSIQNVAGGTVKWDQVGTPSWYKDGYKVTAAQAANHIRSGWCPGSYGPLYTSLTVDYFGVPDTPPATAHIFVIHYAYYQNQMQLYPTQNNGISFPDQSGQAVNFMSPDGQAPFQMLFVPDDFSQTYVVTHWVNMADHTNTSGSPMGLAFINSTQLLPAPEAKDVDSSFAASVNEVVQINNKGEIYYITNAVQNYSVDHNAKWQKLNVNYTVSEAAIQKADNDSKADASSASALASQTGSSSASGAAAASSASGASSSKGKSSAQGVSANFGLTLTAIAAGLASLL